MRADIGVIWRFGREVRNWEEEEEEEDVCVQGGGGDRSIHKDRWGESLCVGGSEHALLFPGLSQLTQALCTKEHSLHSGLSTEPGTDWRLPTYTLRIATSLGPLSFTVR